jgi:cell division protein FtsW
MNRHIDPWLILIVLVLTVGGLLMVLSASAIGNPDAAGPQFTYFYRQIFALCIGIPICAITALTPIKTIRQNHLLFYCATALALLMCFIPSIGKTVNGASRWIGFGTVNVQPSAFAKIAVMISLAHFLHRWRGQIHELRVVLRAALIPIPLMALILFEPDFGTTLIITVLMGYMLLIAGMQSRHIIGFGLSAFTLGIPILFMEQYRLQRMQHFLNPWSVYSQEGYQIIQGWIALHSGGLTGKGLGNSVSKRHFLPEPWTDFIAAVIGEELGFIGIIFLIALFIALLWRGMLIARQARDAFSMYLASTITMMLSLEAIFNLGVVMGLLPPKGLVLPFISYGASAMLANLWGIGLLLSISSERRDIPIDSGWKLEKS